MASSTTHLDLISQSQAQKEATDNAMSDAASTAMVYGRRAATTSGLTWGYIGGNTLLGSTPTFVANGTLTLTASATNYIRKLDSTGVVSFVTSIPTSWPAPNGGYTPLYSVVTGASMVTSYTDFRVGGGIPGAAGAPGGSTTQVQYNGAGAFSGDSRLTFDSTSKITTGQFAIDSNAINAQTGTTYALVAADNGKVVTLSNAAAITVTVPAGLGAGFSCICIQLGAGQVTFLGAGSPPLTINPSTTLKITSQHGAASLIAYLADTFNLSGNITA